MPRPGKKMFASAKTGGKAANKYASKMGKTVSKMGMKKNKPKY